MSSTQQQFAQQPDFPKIVNVSQDPNNPGEVYLKAFLIDDSINKNFWHVPQTALKKYADSFIGRPLIKHPTGDHPDYIAEGIKDASPTFIQDILKHQEQYSIGSIVDVQLENMKDNPDKQAYYAYIKLTNPDYLNTVKSGASSLFVSPQIYDLDQKPPGQSTTNFIPLHLAVVNEPAYGSVAKIRGVCNGQGKPCMNALKKAALDIMTFVENNSSYEKNLANSNHSMPNNNNTNLDPNYPTQQPQQNTYNPNGLAEVAQAVVNPNPTQPYTGVTSKKTQVQEVDANGNIITKVEDFKPNTKTAQRPQAEVTNNAPPNPQQQVPVIEQQNQAPVVPPQVQADFNLPPEITEALKSFQSLKQQNEQLLQRVDNIENFKKTAEEKQLKEASEAQRQTIDQSFAPLFPDEQERAQVVDFFVSLNIPDDALNKLLDFVTKGVLQTAASGAPNQDQGMMMNKQAPPTGKKKPGFIKGAALVYNNNNQSLPKTNSRGIPITSTFSNGFFGDINIDNLD